MPATLTPDLLAHLAAVRDKPGEPDDADLGSLADHLEEAGDAERAELIRVQVEATTKHPQGMNCGTMYCSVRSPEGLCDDCLAYRRLSRRESARLSRNPAWLSVACPECGEAGVAWDGIDIRSLSNCPFCNGTGDLLRRPVEHTVMVRRGEAHPSEPRATLTRGFVTVTLPSALCWEESRWTCPDCRGRGQKSVNQWATRRCRNCKGDGQREKTVPHPVLAAVLASPVGPWVRRVVVSDKRPGTWSNGTAFWNHGRNDAASLPPPIWEMVEEDHPTPEAAVNALALAVPLFARRCRP